MPERRVPRMFGKRLPVSKLDPNAYYFGTDGHVLTDFERQLTEPVRWRVNAHTGYRIFDALPLAEEWAEQKVREFWKKLGERIGEKA